MFTLSPRRLLLVSGLALAILGCASKPSAPDAPAASAPPPSQPTAPAPVASATPAAPSAPVADAPAARRGPTPAGRWNGTPPEAVQKPGSYMVLSGKPAPVPNVKLGDKATVARIVNEGKNNNQVMDHLTHITTKIGPRLTGSSNVETANRWAMEQFKSWGLHSELHEWGTIPVRFDRGPSTAKVGTVRDNGEFRSQREMEFTTPAWAAGTDGPVRGQVIKMPETEAQYEAVKDKLKGSWILIKAQGPGRRGVGGMSGNAGARQRFFAETRKKMESGDLKLADAKPAPNVETKPEAKPETRPVVAVAPAPEGITGAWEGTATGGRIPEGGAPFTLDLKLDGAGVSGTMAYTNYHSAPVKEGKWDDTAKTLTFAWEGPGGVANYTFKLDGQVVKGESKRDDGSVIALAAKRPGKELAKVEPAKEEPKPAPAAEPAPQGIAGNWEGTATGGPIPEGGVPFILEVKLVDGKASGTMDYPNFHAGPIKDAKWDDATRTLTYRWDSPVGSSAYSITLDGSAIKGESKLPAEIGGAVTLTGKRGSATKVAAKDPPKEDASESSSGPTIDERIFMAGPAGYISSSGDERVNTGGNRNISMDKLPRDCEITVRRSDYDWMNSRCSDGVAFYAEINCDHKFSVGPDGGPVKCYNTVAEIKGTEWPDEVVIVSAHLDSWNGPGSQGTTDNGTGSSVTIEAARILAAAQARPKRTIRFVLWTGEEQGLLGSAAYVKELREKDLLKNISACFVDDGGTNFEGGIQCLDSQVDYFGAATAPINGVFWSSTDNRYLDVNIQPSRRAGGGMAGGSSDHASFQRAGVPGFFWDEVGRADYPFGWHTQNDKLTLAIPEYLIQSSTCAAVTAYNLACAPSLLPRQPLPQKEEEKKDTSANATDWREFGTDAPAAIVQPAASGAK